MDPLFFHDDPQFWYETQRALGHAVYGGSDLGEVATTAARITAGDYESWYREWTSTARRVLQHADTAREGGHAVSARDHYLRASNYFRCAEFFLHGNPDDPRIQESYDDSLAAFRAYVELTDGAVREVEVPFEGTTLHGYFYRGGPGERPTVVMHNGFDGSVEEMHFFGAAAAVERGYHVLSFDGPGQPSSRRRDGLTFRADWETVVTPVLDWLFATHPEVDQERTALLGVSMGGILAPRAAAFEHRLAGVIALDGVFDLGGAAMNFLPMDREQAEAALRAEEAPELDAALEKIMAANPTARWGCLHGMYTMNVDSPRKFMATYFDYSLGGGIAEQIQCPVLVADAQDDLFFAGQPELLHEHLNAASTLVEFTEADGAAAHCHSGAQRFAFATVYDWLDNVLRFRGAVTA
ncbi:alpha/beta fold hydrolase [Cellulomonas sp. IC4_254]|uniref:alpha/beta hydrolase family protein n=1 Tax=Cellulomonas sp. IC4_254 TaxID=2714040 RepID=UPI001422B2C1|nr:alpha/beta fold hydrolase [Cellulomonas sp. IC4_254]NHT16085.1 alpha/beta hydrolase [Cellulomonas sp. IC4_254]